MPGQSLIASPCERPKRVQLPENAAYSANARALLHGAYNIFNPRAQGAHRSSQASSTEFIRLGFVERLRLGTLLRLWTWFRFRRTRYRQRLGFGMLLAPGLSHDLAHQHGARPQRSGDAKSPGRFDKYFPAKNCAPRFLGCKTHFKQTIMLASDLAYATRLQPVGQ